MKKLFKSSSLILSTFLTLSLLASTPGEPKPVKSSSVSWTASKVTRTHSGIITLGDSHLEMDGDRIVGGRIEVDMSTIVVTDLEGEYKAKLEGHLKSDDFFSVEKFNTATFKITEAKSSNGKDYTITGTLTIKGIAQKVSFPAVVAVAGKKVTATGKITFDRTKFDIKYRSGSYFEDLADKMIYDEVKLDVKLVATV